MSFSGSKSHLKKHAEKDHRPAQEKNVWGTFKEDVDPDFCSECERENPHHYDNCPLYYTYPDVSEAEKLCPTQTPEPHILGEFSMSCYYCHMEVDS